MSSLLSRLQFCLTATNEHGVHSPFVFSYVTKCLYAKPVVKNDKPLDVFFKSIPYFDAKTICIKQNTELETVVKNRFPDCTITPNTADIIHQSIENFTSIKEEKLHNDSMLLFTDIRKNTETIAKWEHLIADKKATVTIDFFYCGIVFVRKEQVKEHFRIR